MPAQNPRAGNSPRKLIPIWRADWQRLMCAAVLAAGTIAVYGRTFHVPLLFDDYRSIADNLTIRHWSTAFWPPLNTTACGRPILNLSLALNYAVSGTAMLSYHVLNLAIHVLAGLTLFGIIRRTLRLCSGQALRLRSGQALRLCSGQALRLRSGQALARRGDGDAVLIGFSAALLWTLHPLQTEAVTYVVQRAESLMGLFYLLTVYCFIRVVEADVRNQRLWSTLCVAACLLGMATKEVMASAPLIVLLYDRTFVAGSFREAWRRRRVLHVTLAATWLLLAGLVVGSGWDRNGTSGFAAGITPGMYWLTQCAAVARYLWLSVWPHPLVFDYGLGVIHHAADVGPEAGLIGLLFVGTVIALWCRPAWGFLGAWFLLILAPTSLVPVVTQPMAEHRMYLPLAAVIVAAVAGLHAVMQRPRDNGPQDHGPRDHGPQDHGPQDHGPRDHGLVALWSAALRSCGLMVCGPVVSVVLVFALGLGLLTARRNQDYRSELALWNDTVAKRPDNERAHNNLGLALAQIPGRLNDAIAEYEEALRLKPDLAEAHNNLGRAWAQTPGRLNDAIAQYGEALRVKPDYADAHNSLGLAWAQLPGRLQDAIIQYQAALRLRPDNAEAHNNLGLAWAQLPGRQDEAIAEYGEALRLQPDYAEVHNNLGLDLAQKPGRLNDAIAQYEDALRLKPEFAEAHNNLGLAWAQLPGRLNDAVAQYGEALRLKPEFVEAHNNLGLAWSKLPGRLPDAIAQYEEALRLKPDSAEAHYNLGNACLKMPGRLNDAIVQFKEALRLKGNVAPAWHNLGVSWFQLGNLAEAEAAFREEVRLSPDDPVARQALATTLQQTRGH